jgi:hypothetical protein
MPADVVSESGGENEFPNAQDFDAEDAKDFEGVGRSVTGKSRTGARRSAARKPAPRKRTSTAKSR